MARARTEGSITKPGALRLGTAAALVALALSGAPAQAADAADGVRQGNAVTRFFGRFKTQPVRPAHPVPGYIAREADDEGALDVRESALDRNVTPYDRALGVGNTIDRFVFGLPPSPETELRDKYRRSQDPAMHESRAGIFSGLSRVRAGRVIGAPDLPPGATVVSRPDSNGVFSDGTPSEAAPRIQDVAKLCSDPRALANIIDRFNWAQKKTWETSIRMVAVEGPREHYYRTVGDYAYLSKRYCRATAVMNTGHKRVMVYQIIEDTGGAGGFYDRARWCVRGYDWMNEHEPACRVLRAL